MGGDLRILKHPILAVEPREDVTFTFDGTPIRGKAGEPVTSALFASGIRAFGLHPKDRSPQGIFCANGQCAQCLVLADGVPVKGCMFPVRQGLEVRSLSSLPALKEMAGALSPTPDVPEHECDVLVVGGGPSGITGAVEIARHGYRVLVVDDKHGLGGKLVLQTHSFFGSVSDCYAGTRGIDIARILTQELEKEENVEVWLQATVAGCFADGKFGVIAVDGYRLVKPRGVLIATGAREKSLAFPGWDLPGVYGAGAFQTLLNRDLVKPSRNIFVLGGGNVGLIAAYHALQAGLRVAGLAEAMPKVGGYKVHKDKIARLGVPIFTSHTVIRAEGAGRVERVTVSRVDGSFLPVEGTERPFDVDTLLVAVGLDPVDELFLEARNMGFPVRAAGDAQEIAEASAAMFSGRIEGRRLVNDLGGKARVPEEWEGVIQILKSKPGALHDMKITPLKGGVYPVIRCVQEIPCDPCVEVCPKKAIEIPSGNIVGVPEWTGECTGCGRCVAICPGLAISLVDERETVKNAVKTARVTVPFEFLPETIQGETVATVDGEGNAVGRGKVLKIKTAKSQDRCNLVVLEVDWGDRLKVAGFRIQAFPPEFDTPAVRRQRPEEMEIQVRAGEKDPIICRCERVRKSQIVSAVKAGTRDMNQLKSVLRCGMGACGGKTCTPLIRGIFRELGIPVEEVAEPTRRPFVTEAPLGLFAGLPGAETEA